MLTELEGSILSELQHRGSQTAFQIRRSFATSPSVEWRGSAGAVYPAIKRLERDGLIQAVAKGDGRATRLLSITDEGRRAMLAWATEPARAVSVGIDPFRMRAGIWLGLPAGERTRALQLVKQALLESVESLEAFVRRDDAIERASVNLSLGLQRMRLSWIDAALEEAAEPVATPRPRHPGE